MNTHIKKFFNSTSFLILLPLLIFSIVSFIIGFNGLYGQDSHEYYRYSRAILNFLVAGSSPGDYFWPVYYPILGAVIGLVIDNLVSLQLISILSLAGSLYFLYNILNESFGSKTDLILYLVITFLLSPYVIRNSVVVMSDMLTVFCITSSFYFFIGYLYKGKLKQIIFFTIVVVVAVLTRYAAVVVLIIPSIILLFDVIKKRKISHLTVAIIITIILIVPHIIIRQSNATDFLGHTWLQSWSPLNYFKQDFITPDGTEHFRLPNILNSFSNIFYPTYLAFGIILIFLLHKKFFKNKTWRISLFTVLIYALFLAGIPYQNQRFFLLSYPFVLVVLFPAFERLMSFLHYKKLLKYLMISFMLTTQSFFCLYFFKSAYDRNILEKEVAAFVKDDRHKLIYSFDIDVSFMSYDVNKIIINLKKEKLESFNHNSLIIFNENKFKTQWAGMNPMLNWKKLKSNYVLNEIKDFGDGWKAFEIK